MDFQSYLETRQTRINDALKTYLPPENAFPESIHKAMHYSVFAGGKRLRPILALAAFESCNGQGDVILPPACAIELIHTYSLIHDDLPAMDDDDLRRGKPTSHKVFGEAIAILAGDALLTHAFQLIAQVKSFGPAYAALVPDVLEKFGEAAGTLGMIGGQILDLQGENKMLRREDVNKIHELKTAKLIALPLVVGAMFALSDEDTVAKMEQIGLNLGLAFQIVDDILDVQGSGADFGKPVGSDQEKHKATYPAAIGLEASREAAQMLITDTKALIAQLPGQHQMIEQVADFIIRRTH